MNIYESLAAINQKIDAITKTRNNTQQNFKFRGIDDVMNELHKHFAEFKVVILPEVVRFERSEKTSIKTDNNGKSKEQTVINIIVDMKYTFIAEDGSSVFVIVPGEALDYGDKATTKAMSIALKYALLQMFLIPTEEEKDPDGESYYIKPKNATTSLKTAKNDNIETQFVAKINELKDGAISEKQLKRLYAIAKENLVTPETAKDILKGFGYDHANEILIKDYENICKKIEDYVPFDNRTHPKEADLFRG